MQKYFIERDNEPDLVIVAMLLARASSSADPASSGFSGSLGWWTELRLYFTDSGKFVCKSVDRTELRGEHDQHRAAVCDTEDAVCEFFGASWLAKELYDEAGINWRARIR